MDPVRRRDDSARTLALFAAGGLALALNSAYLAATAAPTFFYFSNVVVHVALGLALSVLGAVWLVRTRPHLPIVVRVALVALGIGLLFGLVVLQVGAARPTRWMLHAHIAASVTGAVLFAAWLAVRVAGMPAGRSRFAVAVALVAVAGAGLWAVVARDRHDAARRATHRIENPVRVPASMLEEGGGPDSPFFPSSSDTNTGRVIPANFFLTSGACGRCHKDIYDQWNSSAHHFSSFNNQWYRKSIEYMQDVVGTKPSKWCAGCHDHAVFFNGRFDRPIREQIDTPEAQAGLGCMSCHAITHVKSTMGQGDFVIEYPPLHDLATSENPVLRWTHDKLLMIDPQPHREAFLKPFHREQTAEFCSSCHKVHLDKPVNDYRWFRGFNDYDNWQASGVSGQGARSFYYPAQPQKCADCHMPLVDSNDPAATNGRIRSHRFIGANTALPFVNGDQTQFDATKRFLQDGQISVDVFGLVRGEVPPLGVAVTGRRPEEPRLSSTFAVGEESNTFGEAPAVLVPPGEVVGPLDTVDAVVRRGESVRVEVVVRTRKVGHFFPGGTVDAFDVWVELEARDADGRVVLHSGAMADGGRGPVDPGAHFFRSLLLDEQGNPINKRNAWMARSVAYVRLIPPGAADTVHYRLRVPADAKGPISLQARVNYRKFAWWNTQWAFAGVRDPQHADYSVNAAHDNGRWVFTGSTADVSGGMKAIPDVPVVAMGTDSTSLRVVDADAPLPAESQRQAPDVRERWNDYGIGLLLQGDIKGAEAAFLRVTEMEPGYADGWVNVGRARLQEGNVSGAEEVLRRALEVDPDLAKSHFFLGMALKALGRYDEALVHLREAAARYPRDRVVLNQTGRVLFLKRQYREALTEFRRVLAIDPEDLQAHYNMMLAYQGLGDPAAAQERVLYERLKADESAQSITGPYRRLHPHDNNERQSIHEHGPPLEHRPAPPSYSPARTAETAGAAASGDRGLRATRTGGSGR